MTKLRFKLQSPGLWAIYEDGNPNAIETEITEEDALFNPRYRDEALLVIFALRARTDPGYAKAYARLRIVAGGDDSA